MESQVAFQETKREWFTQMPNVITRLLADPYLFRVYAFFREVAGEEGNCSYSIKFMAQTCGMSDRKFLECKKKLAQVFPQIGMPLIHVKQRFTPEGDRDTDAITVLDIWSINSEYKKTRKFSNENSKVVDIQEPIANSNKVCGECDSGGSECSSPPVVNVVHSNKRSLPQKIYKEIYKEKKTQEPTKAPSNKTHIFLNRDKEEFEGITQDCLEEWMRTFTKCDVVAELRACLENFLNKKIERENWFKTIVNWLEKANKQNKKIKQANQKLACEVQKLALNAKKKPCFETPTYIHPPKYRKIYFDEPVDEFKKALYEACNLED